MPGFGMLQDGFDDGVIGPVWSQSYGDLVEAGGRARIPCTSGFAGYRSASVYTLTWSQLALRAYPPDPTGATTAALSLLVLSDTGGTDAGFIVDRAQSAMGLYLRVGYADPAALFPAYDAVAHAWLRLREAGGSLYWEASPDGTAWTVLRTAAAPAWTAQTNLSFLMESHRDAGPSNFAEVDNLNIGRPGRISGAVRTDAGPGPYARTGTTLRGG